MHLIWFIMVVISTPAPTGAAAAARLPVTTLRGVISGGRVYGGEVERRVAVASITADIHRSSVHSQMMMINIRRIIAANETRFADESHSLKSKRGGAGRKKKKGRRWGGGHTGRSEGTTLIIQSNGVN